MPIPRLSARLCLACAIVSTLVLLAVSGCEKKSQNAQKQYLPAEGTQNRPVVAITPFAQKPRAEDPHALLIWASGHHDYPLVEKLLADGGDPNIFDGHSEATVARDTDSLTPLMAAAAAGDCKMIDLLIEYDARTNFGEKLTPLVIAVGRNQYAAVKCLLKSGADLSWQNDDGFTLVYLARRKGYQRIEQLLREHNAPERSKRRVRSQRNAKGVAYRDDAPVVHHVYHVQSCDCRHAHHACDCDCPHHYRHGDDWYDRMRDDEYLRGTARAHEREMRSRTRDTPGWKSFPGKRNDPDWVGFPKGPSVNK